MKDAYFTITGLNYYYGSNLFEKGMKVKLVKEPDNKHDTEAIKVELKGIGKVGYVANSPHTIIGESMSAGRLYDKIGDGAKGKVVFVTDKGILCRLKGDGRKDEKAGILDQKMHSEE